MRGERVRRLGELLRECSCQLRCEAKCAREVGGGFVALLLVVEEVGGCDDGLGGCLWDSVFVHCCCTCTVLRCRRLFYGCLLLCRGIDAAMRQGRFCCAGLLVSYTKRKAAKQAAIGCAVRRRIVGITQPQRSHPSG